MLIVMRTDLLGVMGEAEFVRAFGAFDYLIVLDTDASETAQMANQVLPIGTYPETDGSFHQLPRSRAANLTGIPAAG